MDNSQLPLALNFTGPAVGELQTALVSLGFTIPATETQPPVTPDVPVFGAGTRAAVIQLQTSSGLSPNGIFDANTNLALTVLLGTSSNTNYVIEGRIVTERGDPAANQQLRLVPRGFGSAELRPLAEGENVTTDANGNYRIEYEPATPNNIELQLVQGEVHTSLTSTKFGAGKFEVVNVVAPELALPLVGSEYDRLSAVLTPLVGGEITLLQNARETQPTADDSTGQQDITFLHQATKWDARLIALNATAQALSATTQSPESAAALDAQILYGIARVGLPTGATELSLVKPDAVRKAIGVAVDKKLIDLGENEQAVTAATDAFVSAFESFSRQQRVQQTSSGSLASADTLMQAAGLDDTQRLALTTLLTDTTIPRSELWTKAAEQGLDATKLQVQGKLAFLTLNNTKLVTDLQTQFQSPDDLVQLVDKGFYQPEAWEAQLGEVTPGNVDQLVPSNYTGDDPDIRKKAYARDLARKVRMSYPTAVVGHMLQAEELDMQNIQTISAETPGFLKAADRFGYRIGQETIESFALRAQADLDAAGYPADIVKTITPEIKAVQRLAQLSPSIESLQAIASLNFKSASEIVAIPYDDFVLRYRDKFPPNDEIDLVYRKAEQVDSTVRSFFPVVQQAATTSVVFATAVATPTELEVKRNTLVNTAPTLEKLFGSLDFCECEHCRSVFSPAAYLVDLLHFLDPDQDIWDRTIQDWADTHGGVVYPFENADQLAQFKEDWAKEHGEGSEPPAEIYGRKPFDVLTQDHRPDLPNLQLSCENTTTALPYIDIVNEIQEYYVANGALSADAARNTIGATTPELLAEPQIDNSAVYGDAYDELRKARYPMSLPFDLWLSTSRSMFDHFETPLGQALELFRQSDALFSTAGEPTAPPYDRFDIFCEQLGLTPATVDLLIDKNGEDIAANWSLLYGYADQAAAFVDLKPPLRGEHGNPTAKLLARRLGVTYQELTDLLTTWFINPKLDGLVLLHKLGLDVEDVVRYKNDKMSPAERDAYDKRLAALNSHLGSPIPDVVQLIDEQWADGAFDQVFVLQTPPNCTFEDTHIRFANPSLDASDEQLGELLFKINVFVRLWRGLGWSLAETDQALRVFLPGNGEPPAVSDLPAGLQTALIYMSHLQTLASWALPGPDRRLSLLTFWSNLATTGKQPLYEKLFLSRNVLDRDGVFDSPLGAYLAATNPPELIRDHLPVLRQALGLTAVEIDLILTDADLRLDAESDALPAAPLTIENVSLLYRYLAFAKAFRLSIPEFVTLKSLSKKDPFLALPRDPDEPSITVPIEDIDDDHPFEHTIGFVDETDKVTASGFSVEALDYLFRHQFDPVGNYRQDTTAVLSLVKAIAGGLQQIETAHPLPETPDAYAEITDEFLRQELSILLPPDVVDIFLRMWTGTEEFEATEIKDVDPPDRLHPAFFGAIPSVQVNYANNIQELTYRGVLTESTKRQIVDSVRTWPVEHISNPFGSAEVRPTAKALANLETLLDSVHDQAKERFDYFAKHLGFLFSPETAAKLEIMPDVCLPDDDPQCRVYEYLFNSDPTLCAPGDTRCEKTRQDALAQRRALLVQAIVLTVRETLSRRLISETVAATLGSDPELTETLLVSTDLLAEPSNDAVLMPLLAAFDGARERGVTLRRSAGDGPDITWGPPQTVAAVDTQTLDPDTNHVIFEGYFEVPARGDYEFLVEVGDAAAAVELRLDYVVEPVLSTGILKSVVGDLKPGIPYRFTFFASNLNGGGARLLISGGAVPKDNLGQLPLVPADPVQRIERAWTLLSKALTIVTGLQLSERELRFLRANATGFDGFDLKSLPVESPVDATDATNTFAWFLRTVDYVTLRSTMAGDSDGLIDIFERARLSASFFSDTTPAAVDDAMKADLAARIADLTRREAADVLAAMATLRLAAEGTDGDTYFEISALRTEVGLRRLWDVLQVVERFGVPAAALAGQKSQDGTWTPGWVQPRPNLSVTTDLRRTVRARYAPEVWQRIAPSIFDPLRQRQRDALVAYLMSNLGFDRMEQLYEYFLVDPGMEPVVQTSRIRMAIASVQLFVQRCLLNLERLVHPSAINAQHWQWMKRYRVWEANRKIFVYPENWLEPEFRDDKTHLFQELEGTLLAGDVTDELAEDAFFAYLKKLEELAHLEIVTFFADEQADPLQNVLHVIGRTASEPRKYFYRRYKQGAWTPWEPVTAEIEGDHIVAIMWHSRLHLFWVTFTLTPNTNPGGVGSASETKSVAELTLNQVSTQVTQSATSQLDIRLNWSDLYQGEWSVREAGVQATGDQGAPSVTPNFDTRNVSIHVSKDDPAQLSDGTLVEGPVFVHLKSNDGNTNVNLQFRVASKHVPPQRIKDAASDPPLPPFELTSKSTVRYGGTGAFQASFDERVEILASGEKKVDEKPDPKTIFNRPDGSGPFTVVGPSHRLKKMDNVVGPLISPFFYSDDQIQLFGLPELKEERFREHTGYVVYPWLPDFIWDDGKHWVQITDIIHPQIPEPDPGPFEINKAIEFDPGSLYAVNRAQDLYVNTATVLRYDDALITRGGGFNVREVQEGAIAGGLAESGFVTNAFTQGSATLSGTVLVSNQSLGAAVASPAGASLTVMGAGGANNFSVIENVWAASGNASLNLDLLEDESGHP